MLITLDYLNGPHVIQGPSQEGGGRARSREGDVKMEAKVCIPQPGAKHCGQLLAAGKGRERSLQKECSPADISILAPQKPFWKSDLQNDM